MGSRASAEDVERLARAAGVRIPDEDVAPLAEALSAHLEFVEPLLRADLSDAQPALTLDPRWRD
jgi:Asp-tRNA(Asn)/Glu-tRNA(Gln) amidotransferase C subunit